MLIGIFDALRIFVNPLGFFVRVEKDKISGKYRYSFCRVLSNGVTKVLANGQPFTTDVNVMIRSVEGMLQSIFSHGKKTYLQEGTYMFNHYNVLRPRRVLSESDVLNESRINELIFNLHAEQFTPQTSEEVVSENLEDTQVEIFDIFVNKPVETEGRHDA